MHRFPTASLLAPVVALLVALALLPASATAQVSAPARPAPTSAPPAPAKAAACQVYTGCLPTKTGLRLGKATKVGSRFAVCAKTIVRGSNVLPKGRLKVSIRRKSGGFTVVRNRAYGGGSQCLRTVPLKRKGKYVVRAKFISPSSSVFLRSARKKTFKVRR